YSIVKDFLGRYGDEVKELSKGRKGNGSPRTFLGNSLEYISFMNFESMGLYTFSQIYKKNLEKYFSEKNKTQTLILMIQVKSIRNREVMYFKNNFRRYFNKKLKALESD
ncbi:MAG: hypothetical protein U9Q06_03340, partial [Nanoarchaeota archaeon]|nr:hypothetical protein [Nanoarchaeota archaeon]